MTGLDSFSSPWRPPSHRLMAGCNSFDFIVCAINANIAHSVTSVVGIPLGWAADVAAVASAWRESAFDDEDDI